MSKPTVDPVIMAELLEQPEIKDQIKDFTPEMIEWYKDLLINQGIYARYCKERKAR